MTLCWKVVLLIAILGKFVEGQACTLSKPEGRVIRKCFDNGYEIPCTSTLQPETIVRFHCSEHFQLNSEITGEIKCLENGLWSHPQPKCVPKCGKIPQMIPLIIHGKNIDAGIFPWQVALFHRYSDVWQFACGANLISTKIVLTAAHCAWHLEAKDMKVGLGKRKSDFNEETETSQMIQVAEIEKLDSYQDSAGNYNGDLALLILKEPAKINSAVSPICIDWELKFVDQQLVEGNTGIALGWGLTENDTFSADLKAIRLPVVSDEHCIQQQQRDFKKYITYTSFCAGFNNGSGVCNGDSGGGLSFLDPVSDTWYLQGIVSLSPRRSGSTFCDPKHYTVFTKVAMFTSWLEKMEEREILLEQKEDKLSSNQENSY